MQSAEYSATRVARNFAAAGVVVVLAVGCSGRPVDGEHREILGEQTFAIELAPGFVVDRVDYTVTGNGVAISDHVDTVDPGATASV